MRIQFDELLKVVKRYNADLLDGEPPVNLTEMAGIMDVQCDTDLTKYDSCVDGTGCLGCSGGQCMLIFG